MEKSKLEVIQDDILAVKHALANNIAYEGLQGDQLKAVLSTLFSQRAQQPIATAATAPTSGGNGTGEPASSAAAGGPQDNGTSMSRVPVNGSRAKAVSAKKKPTKITSPTSTSEPPSDITPAAASEDTQQTEDNETTEAAPTKKATPAKSRPHKRQHKPAPRPAQEKKQASTAEKPAAKKRKKSLGDVLRELRKSIKVGDFVSVLGDVSLRGTWEKVWVKGEVVREVSKRRQSSPWC